MVVAAVAIIGAKNNPVLIHRCDEDASLDLHFVLHGALDLVDEAVTNATSSSQGASPSKGSAAAKDCFLGMLGLIENYAVYCYHSNTKMKVLLAIEAEMDQEKMPKDEVVKGFLRNIYEIYVDSITNPFFDLDFGKGTKTTVNESNANLLEAFQARVRTTVEAFVY